MLWLRDALNWAVLPAETPETDERGRVRCSCPNPACDSPGKHPSMSYKHHTGPLPLEDLRMYFAGRAGKNACVLTGVRSGILVGDVDPRNGGTLDALWGLGWPQETPIALSGGGGWHVYVACPSEGLASVDSYATGIEVKANGKLVILPASLHPSGQRYRWLPGHEPWSVGLAPLPPATLAALVAAAQPPAQTQAALSPRETKQTVKRAAIPGSAWPATRGMLPADLVALAVERAHERADGGRHHTMTRLASRLARKGLSKETLVDFLLDYQQQVAEGWAE